MSSELLTDVTPVSSNVVEAPVLVGESSRLTTGYSQLREPITSNLQTTPAGRQALIYRMAPEGVPNWIVASIAILMIGMITLIAMYLVNRQGRQRISRRFDQPIARTVIDSIRIGILILGVSFAVFLIGYQPLEVLLSIGIPSAILGPFFAILASAAVLLVLPYKPGDVIELPNQNQMGLVEDITFRHTKINTFDKTLLITSNRRMRKRDIVNYTTGDDRTRQSLDLLVSYDSNLKDACEKVADAASVVEGVVSDAESPIRIGDPQFPANPTCRINRYADNGVLLTLRFWTEEPFRLPAIKGSIQKEVWKLIHKTDVDMDFPFPHRHLMMDDEQNEMHVILEDRRSVNNSLDEQKGN